MEFLVEGDEQLDHPNGQTCMECYNTCAAYVFGEFQTQQFTIWADASLHLLLPKCFMD